MKEKRLISGIAVLTALMVFVPAAKADITYYTDGFESYDLGYTDIAGSGNWRFDNEEHTSGVVNTKSYSGSQSYSLGSTSISSANMYTNNKIPTDKTGISHVVVNAKMYLGEKDSGDNFRATIVGLNHGGTWNGAGGFNLKCDGTNNDVMLEYFSEGATVTGETITGGGLLSKWLDVTLTFDVVNETYDYTIVDTSNSSVLASRTGIAYNEAGTDVNEVS